MRKPDFYSKYESEYEDFVSRFGIATIQKVLVLAITSVTLQKSNLTKSSKQTGFKHTKLNKVNILDHSQ